jgi:hypothetical protein
VPTALLNKQLVIWREQENMHPPVLEAEPVDDRPHFLVGDDIVIIDNIKQFIGHVGVLKYQMNAGRKEFSLHPVCPYLELE